MQEKKQRKPATAEAGIGADLAARIAEEGQITVADYMAAAASHYYANKTPFGPEGDFVTAPEISQMFGEMIGAWCVDLWLRMGRPERVQLIELGPGRGTLMADIMRTVSAWPDFKAAVSLHLVETSPQLRQAQAAALKACRPTWYDTLGEVPEGFGFIIANEFFDALPIHQFKKTGGEWRERCVDYDALEDIFAFTTEAAGFEVAALMPADFLDAPEGSVFEVCPAGLSVLELMARRIDNHGGAGLIVDYGHVASGLGDTLQSLHRHSYSDVLEDPGTKDITAHVDFATFATVAAQHAQVHGPVTQGTFLQALGIGDRARALSEKATPQQCEEIKQALHRLTSGVEMGALFKVMALTPLTFDIIPAGFHDDADAGAV